MIACLLLSGNAYAGWFDKKIHIRDCYDPREYKNFKEFLKNNTNLEWRWEIDLEKDTAILSMIHQGELNMVKHFIKMKTDRYIIVSDGKTADVQFDLKNEVYITEEAQKFVDLGMPRKILLKCKFK